MKRATINANGLNLFYRDTGSDSQTILCLHGKWGRGETWTDFMTRYQDRYRIIAPDQRGHGLSDKPIARYAVEDLSADTYHLVTGLGCNDLIVIGHSMGGRVAGHLAANHPETVKALALLDAPADGPTTLSTLSPEEVPPIDSLTNEWPTPYLTLHDARADLTARFPPATAVEYFMQSLTETVAGYDFMFSRRAMAAIEHYNVQWFDLLPRIQCPTLLLRATDSWALSSESAMKMRKMIRNVEYAEISRSDHMVYADNPNEFYPLMDRFLARVS